MKKKMKLRPLRPAMNDSYTVHELYSVFEHEVFCSSREIDIALLDETVRALDERPDEEAAPHRDQVWEQITQRMETARPSVFAVPKRRAIAFLLILLILFLTGFALGMIDWRTVIDYVYRLEKQEYNVENWSITQKRDLVAALKSAGYDTSSMPALDGKSEEEQEQILTRWIIKQSEGEVNSRFYNLVTRMKGDYETWSLEDKAWYGQMIVDGGEACNGEFISSMPPVYSEEDLHMLTARAWEIAYVLYDDTAAEPETWTPYLFYGYIYPDESVHYWRVHFRGADLGNWLTVQVESTDLKENEMTVVLKLKPPEDVG